MHRLYTTRALAMAVTAAVCHAVLLTLSFASFPNPATLQTREALGGLLGTELRLATYGPLFLESASKRNIYVLGSSSAQDGFAAQDLKFVFPGYKAHNLAMRAKNISDIKLIFQLVSSLTPEEDRATTLFVIGLNFPVFISNDRIAEVGGDPEATQVRHGAVEGEATRWPLFRVDEGVLRPALAPGKLRIAAQALRPVFLAQREMERLKRLSSKQMDAQLQAIVDASDGDSTPPEASLVWDANTEQGRQTALDFWSLYADEDRPLPDEQFHELRDLCAMAGDLGVRVVLVDMPLPQWLKRRCPIYSWYRPRMDAAAPELARMPRVDFVDLHDLEVDFVDSVHPAPQSTIRIAEALKARFTPP